MDQLFKFILDQTAKGKIEKDTAIQLVKELKETDFQVADDIAIIGMSGRAPLANDLDEYWQNISSGTDCITDFPDSRSKDITAYLQLTGAGGGAIRYNENGYMEHIDKFDFKFFKLSKKEASLMDPHQRLFLETVWSAIEDAGYGGDKMTGSNTGVYAGFASSLRDMYLKQIYDVEPSALPLSMVGNLSAVLPSRISYLLDLRGPSMVIDTACSSSLVAVNLAVEALRNGKCEMAVAGGVKLNIMPLDDENMKIGIESTDGRTRAFNDDSNGAGIGEGVVAILLKPLKKALQDGDSVYAVIKGVAMNQDGNSVGLTAPNPASQTDVIVKAWEDAKIAPETISYIETHGTGTKLGDPIEIKGIQDAFRKYTAKTQFCAIGSLKTNIGHSSEAAGLLSLVKTVLAMNNKQLPPSLYFDKPNKTIRFTESPVYVNNVLRPWDTPEGQPRRCGVSSFGISGTNCHVVLEEAPAVAARRPQADSGLHLLTLSAKSAEALQAMTGQYLDYLQGAQPDLASVCYTANTGRGQHPHRLAVIFRDQAELVEKLTTLEGVEQGTFRIITNAKQGEGITEQERMALQAKAGTALDAWIAGGKSDEGALREIARMYIQGADMAWDKLYDKKEHTRLHLPSYPFEPTRCWLDLPDVLETFVEEDEDQFFTVAWQPRALEAQGEELAEKTVLLFKDQRGVWQQYAERLQACSERVITVEFGTAYQQLGEDAFVITGAEADYGQVLDAVGAGQLTRVLHLAGIAEHSPESFTELQDSQTRGVYAMFYLIRALVHKGFDQDVNVTVIAENVHNVTGQEVTLRAESAPLLGIGKAANQEHPGLRIRCIDTDDVANVGLLWGDLSFLPGSEAYQAAYRDGKRYMEEFTEIDMEAVADEPVAIKEGGVYLITGGLGGIGLEVAKSFAAHHPVTLVMINRTPMPDREAWDSILAAGSDAKAIKRIEAIRGIESQGSQVVFYAADTADYDAMETALADVRTRFGQIDGIVHGAGIPGDGFLFKKTQEAFDQVLAPKIFGTWILDRLTAQDQLDFLICFSSGLSILSEPGHGDYTAANAYLDIFAANRSKAGKKTLSINWSTWKETGMAVDWGFNYDSIFKALTTEEALAGLQVVMNKRLSQNVLIGEFSYITQFLYLIDRLPFKLSDKIRNKCLRLMKERGLSTAPRQEARGAAGGPVSLKGKDGEAFSDIEMKVAQIYNAVLGFSEINIHDSFFELGGDSVMLNHMHAILEKELPGAVKLIDLFNYTTVAALSEFIQSKLDGEPQALTEEEQIESYNDMFEELEKGNLSIDDMIKNFT
ncbi:hypothetical protein CBW65_03625 [Tumebacillus avium]|uniref:Uncharacterized protein n=1 Tax=Tumebacillus avium TaxID=1903704 RepID=A0A1Y0IIC2_9BACL|nr:type I polyketide synthase [Tumebacillus avium]ARU60252.1 hypothetical protein CBW65_03625 [Tumebacillus avium]